MTWVAGADGFKGNWIVVLRNLETDEIRCRVVTAFSELLGLVEAPKIVTVDIPIGLPDVAIAGGRSCERHARRILGRRSSCVFTAVGRAALRENSRLEASLSSKRAGGIGIGAQAWGLARKLREADAAMTSDAQKTIREVHPEVCFWAMNENEPIVLGKKSKGGQGARREALISVGFPRLFIVAMARDLYVGPDDFLDACAAVWTAERIVRGTACRLPAEVDCDPNGLDQAIWY